jgi:hypothetical protein
LAADARKTYQAIFEIGAKLQASFRGVMQQAAARLKGLQKVALAFSKSLALIGVGTGLGLVATAVAAISKLFEGATEQAIEANHRQRELFTALMKNRAVQAKGIEYGNLQLHLINKQADALGKVGVVSRDMYEDAATTLAEIGVPTGQIIDALAPMGDLLADLKGVKATQEDMVELANAMGRAINTGQMRPMRRFIKDLTSADQEQFKAMKTRQEQWDFLIRRMQFAAGANVREGRTEEGRIRMMQNHLQEVREEIGNKLLPIQAKLADMWNAILTQVEQFMNAWAAGGGAKALEDLWQAVKDLGTELGITMPKGESLGKMFADMAINQVRLLTQDIRDLIKGIDDFIVGIKVLAVAIDTYFIDPINRVKEEYNKFFDTLKKTPFGFANPMVRMMPRFAPSAHVAAPGTKQYLQARAGLPVTGEAPEQAQLTAAARQKIVEERADIVKELQTPEMQKLVAATLSTEAGTVEDQKNVLEAFVNRMAAQKAAGTYKGAAAGITGGFYGPYNRGETQRVMEAGISAARLQQTQDIISDIAAGRSALGGRTDQGMINEIQGAKKKIGEDYYGFMTPSDYLTEAYKQTHGMQAGGIVRGLTSAVLGERGPEAVIPLSGGGRRAASLLGYANRMMGFGGGGHTVHFAPNITINGNASEDEQRAMDSRLRDLARDFINQFSRAQRHERRLSFESGAA